MHQQITVTVDQPAAGADWSAVISNSDYVRLLSVTAKLTTNATVANRAAGFQVTDLNSNLIAVDVGPTAQVASSAVNYSWRPGNINYNADAGTATIASSCPGFWLPPQSKIATKTALIAAGDQWSLIVVTYLATDQWAARQVEAEITASLT